MSTTHELHVEGHRIVALGFNEDLPGTPAIFMHGITSSVNFWVTGQTPIFKERFRWYSLGLPGHYPCVLPPDFRRADLTPEMIARVLTAAVRQLVGEQPALLVGHSTGGFAALAMAAQTPALARAVISVSGFAAGRWTGPLALLQALARGGPLGEALFRLNIRSLGLNRRFFTGLTGLYAADHRAYFASPDLAPTIERVFPDAQRLDPQAMAHYFNRMPDINITDWLARIAAPVLALAGDRDGIVPPAQARLIAERPPGGELALIADAGHLTMAERPEQYAQIITDWVNRVTPP